MLPSSLKKACLILACFTRAFGNKHFFSVRIQPKHTCFGCIRENHAIGYEKKIPDDDAHLVVLIVGLGAPVFLVVGVGLAATVVKDGDLSGEPRAGHPHNRCYEVISSSQS
jgi:hypothetical protein